MYVSPQGIIPNFYELDQLPYLRMDILNLQSDLSTKLMQSIRNTTHKYNKIFAKIFTFWPKIQVPLSKQQQFIPKLTILTQLPIMSLQNLTYLLTDLKQKSYIDQQQWNNTIVLIQNFKVLVMKIIDFVLVNDFQIKIANNKNVMFNVYYDLEADCFKLKVGYKAIGFQISPFLKKGKQIDFDKDKTQFVIRNQVISKKLKEKMFEKIGNSSKRYYEQKLITKCNRKIQQFYQRQLKQYDQYLLQLKLSHNFSLLRSKNFHPIKFIDPLTKQSLIEPIVSNKNKNCMYGHFIGYNSSSYIKLNNTNCQFCQIQIKQIQQNKLLMFLRDNLFNPQNKQILYCPEWNRWKIVDKIEIGQQKIIENKLLNMRLQNMRQQSQQQQQQQNKNKYNNNYNNNYNYMKNSQQIMDQQKQNIQSQQINQNTQMKSQQQQRQNQQKQIIIPPNPQTQIKYINYMHLMVTIKNLYPVTKNRMKIIPNRQVQYIYYIYKLQKNLSIQSNKNKNNNNLSNSINNISNNINQINNQLLKYYKQLQLIDPVRGKYCTHLQFADLRLFYKNKKIKLNYSYKQTLYICPICQIEIKDNQLIYLKQTLVLIKYIKKLLQSQKQTSTSTQKSTSMYQNIPNKKIDKNSIKIIINNVQKCVFIQYISLQNNQNKKQWVEIQKLYPTLIDPYIHFSQYSLGLHKKNKKLQEIYNMGQNQQSQSQKFQKAWYGNQKNSFTV